MKRYQQSMLQGPLLWNILTYTIPIIITGIQGSLMGSMLCKLFRITDPVAQGVAFGTASHVVGTSRATELGQLQGAVSSLSLAVAGILTAVIFPFILMLIGG